MGDIIDIISPSQYVNFIPDSGDAVIWDDYDIHARYRLSVSFLFDYWDKVISLSYLSVEAKISVNAGTSGTLHAVLLDPGYNVLASSSTNIDASSNNNKSYSFTFSGFSTQHEAFIVGFYGDAALNTRTLTIGDVQLTGETSHPVNINGSPRNTERSRQQQIYFSWSVSYGTQASATLHVQGKSFSAGANSGYTVDAYVLDAGSAAWYVEVALTSGAIARSETFQLDIYNEPVLVTASASPLVLYQSGSITFSWTLDEGTQTSATMEVSTDGATWTYYDSALPGTSSIIGSGSDFSIGLNYWRVNVTTSDGRTGTGNGSFSVLEDPPAPPDPPTIGTVTASAVQPAGTAAVFDGVMIAGISRCKVEASVTAGTNPIASVYFSYPEADRPVQMALNQSSGKYEGTTSAALPGSTTLTITAEDSVGTWTRGTLSVTMEPYAPPTIQINDLFRCDANGAQDDEGARYRINATPNCSSVNNKNSITAFTAGVKGGTSVSIIDYPGRYYTSVTDELTNPDLVYIIVVTATDRLGRTATVERALAGKLRDVVFRRDTTHNTAHVGVGMAPNTMGMEAFHTIELPPDGKLIIGGTDVIAWLDLRLQALEPGTGGSNATTESTNNEGAETS